MSHQIKKPERGKHYLTSIGAEGECKNYRGMNVNHPQPSVIYKSWNSPVYLT